MEREKGRKEAVADMSEYLSEGEKGESTRGRLPIISYDDTMEAFANQQKEKKMYIVLIREQKRRGHGQIRENLDVELEEKVKQIQAKVNEQ
ncbi:hypothetical protein AgCh_010436 [Apium graveolens]